MFSAGSNGTGESISVAQHVKTMLHQSFGIADVPDGYLFFPAELGSQALKSPFIPLLQIHDIVLADHAEALEALYKTE